MEVRVMGRQRDRETERERWGDGGVLQRDGGVECVDCVVCCGEMVLMDSWYI